MIWPLVILGIISAAGTIGFASAASYHARVAETNADEFMARQFMAAAWACGVSCVLAFLFASSLGLRDDMKAKPETPIDAPAEAVPATPEATPSPATE